MNGLLLTDAPRSECDPEVAAPDDSCFVRHALTGVFAEPEVELAFTVGFFRDAFPLHAILLATIVVIQLVVLLWNAMSWTTEAVFLIIVTVSLVGRVLIHRAQDQVLSQWLGSRYWTVSMVLGVVVDVGAYEMDPELACRNAHEQDVAFWFVSLLFALVNGSHGMGFLHKTSLAVMMLIDFLTVPASCGDLTLMFSSGGAIVVGYVIAHVAELHMRRTFAEKRAAEARAAVAEAGLEAAERRERMAAGQAAPTVFEIMQAHIRPHEYSPIRQIGRGSSADQVVLMKAERTGVQVVGKCIKIAVGDDEHCSDIQREVRILMKVRHPHIIEYIDTFLMPGPSICIVMEFAAGGDLGKFIRTAQGKLTVLSEAAAAAPSPSELIKPVQIRNWLAQLCSGLQHLHLHRVLHRDLSPKNVLCAGATSCPPFEAPAAPFMMTSEPRATACLRRAG